MENRIEKTRRSLIVKSSIIVALAPFGLGYAIHGHIAEGRKLSWAMIVTFVAMALSGVSLVVSVVRRPKKK